MRLSCAPRFDAVAVAQLVEHWIVAPGVAGSNPVGHPTMSSAFRRCLGWRRLASSRAATVAHEIEIDVRLRVWQELRSVQD